jgi:hypothetical protein
MFIFHWRIVLSCILTIVSIGSIYYIIKTTNNQRCRFIMLKSRYIHGGDLPTKYSKVRARMDYWQANRVAVRRQHEQSIEKKSYTVHNTNPISLLRRVTEKGNNWSKNKLLLHDYLESFLGPKLYVIFGASLRCRAYEFCAMEKSYFLAADRWGCHLLASSVVHHNWLEPTGFAQRGNWQLIADLAPTNSNDFVYINLRPTSLTNKQWFLSGLYGYMDQARSYVVQKPWIVWTETIADLAPTNSNEGDLRPIGSTTKQGFLSPPILYGYYDQARTIVVSISWDLIIFRSYGRITSIQVRDQLQTFFSN